MPRGPSPLRTLSRDRTVHSFKASVGESPQPSLEDRTLHGTTELQKGHPSPFPPSPGQKQVTDPSRTAKGGLTLGANAGAEIGGAMPPTGGPVHAVLSCTAPKGCLFVSVSKLPCLSNVDLKYSV